MYGNYYCVQEVVVLVRCYIKRSELFASVLSRRVLRHLLLSAMDFLGFVPWIQIAEHGGRDHMCFAADLFEARPSIQDMVAYRPMATAVEITITKLMERRACAFVFLGIFTDERGAVVLAKAKRGMQLDNARCGISTILAPGEARCLGYPFWGFLKHFSLGA